VQQGFLLLLWVGGIEADVFQHFMLSCMVRSSSNLWDGVSMTSNWSSAVVCSWRSSSCCTTTMDSTLSLRHHYCIACFDFLTRNPSEVTH
jgi:hypothetical protein